MNTRQCRLPLTLLLALGVAAGAQAQARSSADATVLPVWNQASGKVEALLLLEPAAAPAPGARWRFGEGMLEAGVQWQGESLGLVCDRKLGLAAIGNLANHCLLASFEDERGESRHLSAGATMVRGSNRFGLNVGASRDTLPAWLSATPKGPSARVEQNTLTVHGQRNIGREATVSLGGTWARARLVPADDLPNLAERWNSRSVTVGAGIGDFGANIVGRVVETPQLPGQQWKGLDLGLTWNTPWSGQLSVGAENVVTRGKNPFAPANGRQDEGTVPYVRYEQDL